MAKIHMILQGKGGVGKSFVATTIAQYKMYKGQTPLCIDTDPINATFAGYKAIDVKLLNIMDGNEITQRNFDELIELIAPSTDDIIIDNGSSSFVPMSHYLLSHEVPKLFSDMGHELMIHTVITGGQALIDTVNGFSHLISQFSDHASFTVWLNPFWGPVNHEGKSFDQMKVYNDHKERIAAIINLPTLTQATFGRDLSDMLQERLTFQEAIVSPKRFIMTRQRLKMTQKQIFGELDKAMVI